MKFCTRIKTPIGTLVVHQEEKKITKVFFGLLKNKNIMKKSLMKEFDTYFSRKKTSFSLPLDLEGTTFQKSVWKAISKIPYGQTRTYSEIAKKIGKPRAIRAVGQACGANPVLIVIPCHRVVGASSLGGYAGGIQNKKWLLQHEGSKLP